MNKTCPHCGAPLPEDAAFCPHCAKSVNQRTEAGPPRPRPVKAILALGILLLIAATVTAVWLANRPKTYDSGNTAEVVYTDRDGSYHLVIGYDENPNQPVPEYHTYVWDGDIGRTPSRLFIRRMDNGENAAAEFMEKVDSVSFETVSWSDCSSPIVFTEPAPHDAYPEAALVTGMDYDSDTSSAELVWTLCMKNGDTIIVREQFIIEVKEVLRFHPEDAPMNTIAELQALIDSLAERIDGEDVVAEVYLPPITYDNEVLNLTNAYITLYGNTVGEGRTTFTNTVHMFGSSGSPMILSDVDFVGDGSGIGLSARRMVIAVGCSFTGWQTGLLAYGSNWVGFYNCRFEDNEIGFHFNCPDGYVTRDYYNNNVFRNNGTAVLLEQVPTDTTLDFAESVFTGNGVDIDNRCGHPVDISEAVFE